MREVTSAMANKMIRSLTDEKEYYLSLENESSIYILAEGEEANPPSYDYEDTQMKIEAIDEQIRRIKHAVNVFNTTTVILEPGITIDEALVEMAQLTRKKDKLDVMRKNLPKCRVNQNGYRSSGVIEYRYVNYDLDKVQEDYRKVCERIDTIQMALDTANQTKTFEI